MLNSSDQVSTCFLEAKVHQKGKGKGMIKYVCMVKGNMSYMIESSLYHPDVDVTSIIAFCSISFDICIMFAYIIVKLVNFEYIYIGIYIYLYTVYECEFVFIHIEREIDDIDINS